MITLLISCPDRPGIVARISQFIFAHHGNIFQSDHHSTSLHDGTFFMRVNFTEDSFTLSEGELMDAIQPIADALDMNWRVLAEAVRLHIEDRVLVYKNKTIVF